MTFESQSIESQENLKGVKEYFDALKVQQKIISAEKTPGDKLEHKALENLSDWVRRENRNLMGFLAHALKPKQEE